MSPSPTLLESLDATFLVIFVFRSKPSSIVAKKGVLDFVGSILRQYVSPLNVK